MKAKRHYLILTICTLLLCVFASGAERLPVEPEPLELIAEPKPLGLIARANPALAGIDKLYVAITQVDAEPNKDGLVWKELQAKIEHRILKEGIKIVPEFVNGKHIHHLINIPQLTVEITMLKVPNSEQYVFCIRTSLKKQVYLTRDGSRPVKAGILKVGPIIEVASIQDMPSAVTNLALEQTEAFI